MPLLSTRVALTAAWLLAVHVSAADRAVPPAVWEEAQQEHFDDAGSPFGAHRAHPRPEPVPIPAASRSPQNCLQVAGDFDFPFNVRRFGAVGDGVADDTAEIQCAIDAAEAYALSIAGSGANGGAVVYFPGGNYLISSTLTVEQHAVSLQGAGVRSTTITRAPLFTSGDTIKVWHPTSPGAFMFGNNISQMRLRASAGPSSGAHLHLVSATLAAYTDLLLEEQFGGIYLEGGLELQFVNTRVASDDYFTSLASGSYFVKLGPVTGNEVAPFPIEIFFANGSWQTSTAAGTIEYGLKIEAADAIYISNVHIMGAARANVLIDALPGRQVTAVRFSNSYFDFTIGNGDASVQVQGQGNGHVGSIGFDNCVFWGGAGTTNGVTARGLLVNSGTSLTGLSVTNSSIFGYTSHGVHLVGGANIVIAGNQIANNNTGGAFGAGVLVAPGVSDFRLCSRN